MLSAPDETDSASAVLRAMVSIADSTVGHLIDDLTLTQFRALRIITEHTPITMSRVADQLALNPSSVTRACERLTTLDLVQRARNPLNKREILLAPTGKGRQIVARVEHERRAVLAAVLQRLEPAVRAQAAVVFGQFAAAAATVPTSLSPGTTPLIA
ncbi:MarR family transcriptional regulator [Kibdelosporangium persicum]|uniref:DNA-binding transcriptional regulator, MarR family n=2 Tax=Kibdelosporangium persicum TaxID=2698649 RepID=A0ABX2FG83_9PSEU|nr:DNA-binding transcriptional regulator, MarR family [Kibdelosporangium persicum]